MPNTLKRQYVSDIGKFLSEFDASHPEKSSSQREEIAKYARIAHLRDNIVPVETSPDSKKTQFWKNF